MLGAAVIHRLAEAEAIGEHVATDQRVDHEGAEAAGQDAGAEDERRVASKEWLKLPGDLADVGQRGGVDIRAVQRRSRRAHQNHRHAPQDADAGEGVDHALAGVGDAPAASPHVVGLIEGPRHRERRGDEGLQHGHIRIRLRREQHPKAPLRRRRNQASQHRSTIRPGKHKVHQKRADNDEHDPFEQLLHGLVEVAEAVDHRDHKSVDRHEHGNRHRRRAIASQRQAEPLQGCDHGDVVAHLEADDDQKQAEPHKGCNTAAEPGRHFAQQRPLVDDAEPGRKHDHPPHQGGGSHHHPEHGVAVDRPGLGAHQHAAWATDHCRDNDGRPDRAESGKKSVHGGGPKGRRGLSAGRHQVGQQVVHRAGID